MKTTKLMFLPAAVQGVVMLLGGVCAARADVIVTAFSQPPNWALGSPQFVSIAGSCSNNDLVPGSCFGVSDRLSLRVPTRPAVARTLTDAQECSVAFGCGNIFPLGGGAIDLIIPNANWVFQAIIPIRDAPGEAPFVSDGLVFFNVGATAHLWLGSNWFDPPPTFPLPDAIFGPGFSNFFDVLPTVGTTSNGEFEIPERDIPALTQTPEPAAILPLLAGIVALAYLTARRRGSLAQRRLQET